MNLKLLFPIFLLFISCSSNFNNENLSIFKYNESSGIYTLDPAFSKDQATVNIANQIFNGLVQLDNHQNVIPSIAKRWEVSDNNLNYKFYLRNDVFFHDHILFKNGLGRRVIADDFVYSLNRLKDTKLASPGAWVLSNVDAFSALNDSVLLIKVKNLFLDFFLY